MIDFIVDRHASWPMMGILSVVDAYMADSRLGSRRVIRVLERWIMKYDTPVLASTLSAAN